jgi:hypothetical protein
MESQEQDLFPRRDQRNVEQAMASVSSPSIAPMHVDTSVSTLWSTRRAASARGTRALIIIVVAPCRKS